jgi:hypothetical protein
MANNKVAQDKIKLMKLIVRVVDGQILDPHNAMLKLY